jgi:hypothetical protein
MSTWLQVLRVLTMIEMSSATLVYKHAPPCQQRHDAPLFLAVFSDSPPNDCAFNVQDTINKADTSIAIARGHNGSAPTLQPPMPACAPAACRTPAPTSISQPDPAIAIGPAESPPLPPAAAPTHQRGALPVLVRRAKASSPPSTMPAGPAAPAQQAHGRAGAVAP